MAQVGNPPNSQGQLGKQSKASTIDQTTQHGKPAPLQVLPDRLRLRHLSFPVFLMNLPLSLSAQIPNNAWMDDLSPSEREVRLDRAIAQFLALYRHIAQRRAGLF
jgi:hypothetical protein